MIQAQRESIKTCLMTQKNWFMIPKRKPTRTKKLSFPKSNLRRSKQTKNQSRLILRVMT